MAARASPLFAARLLACLLAALPGSEAGWEADWVTAQGASFDVIRFSHPTVTLQWVETPSIAVDGFVVTVTSTSCGQADSATGGDNVCNFQQPNDASPAVLLGPTNLSYTVDPILGAQEFTITVKAFRWSAGVGSAKDLSNEIKEEYLAQARLRPRERSAALSTLAQTPRRPELSRPIVAHAAHQRTRGRQHKLRLHNKPRCLVLDGGRPRPESDLILVDAIQRRREHPGLSDQENDRRHGGLGGLENRRKRHESELHHHRPGSHAGTSPPRPHILCVRRAHPMSPCFHPPNSSHSARPVRALVGHLTEPDPPVASALPRIADVQVLHRCGEQRILIQRRSQIHGQHLLCPADSHGHVELGQLEQQQHRRVVLADGNRPAAAVVRARCGAWPRSCGLLADRHRDRPALARRRRQRHAHHQVSGARSHRPRTPIHPGQALCRGLCGHPCC